MVINSGIFSLLFLISNLTRKRRKKVRLYMSKLRVKKKGSNIMHAYAACMVKEKGFV